MISSDILKKVRQIQIRTRRRVSDVFAGQYHSVFKGQGMEFHEVREYIPGDDIRSIDWNVTARTGSPFVKKFIEERELTVMLLVDVSGSNMFGSTSQLKKDLVAEIAAVLGFTAVQNGDRVGLLLFSDRVEKYVPPNKGTPHVLRLIRDVLYHEPESRGTSIEPALSTMNNITNRRCVTFLISDFLDDGYQRALTILSKRHDITCVVVGDKLEQAWPPVGLVEWEDTESGQRVLVDTSDPATRRALNARQTSRRNHLLHSMWSSGVDTIEVFAGEPYEKEFIRFFKMREQRLRV